jgi:hypothetical protein
LAEEASRLAAGPVTQNLSAVCRFVTAGPVASSSGSAIVDVYALLFTRRFSDAVPPLEKLYRGLNPSNDAQIRTLLAWAYVETGRLADASRVLGPYPMFLASGDTLFAPLIFPRYLFLRGAVLEQNGRNTEAKRLYELFLRYSGDLPDVFGNDAIARRKLAR